MNLYDLSIKDYQNHFTSVEMFLFINFSLTGTTFIIIGIFHASKNNYALHLDDIVFALLSFATIGLLRLIEYPLYFANIEKLSGLNYFNYLRATPFILTHTILCILWLIYAFKRKILLTQPIKILIITLILFFLFGYFLWGYLTK
ncbi:hypothetical protein [Shewanella surugensis]|uniref:Uncharacterized protein n=1 Tax=Shewanella surugensis TaxID=212020 RepID=A0ABT0LK21_9GAMM|nr:hypothetical protein [Shewanella surugensis]MCL1128033.1 hypothetical protein [Shewanella surugensis]